MELFRFIVFFPLLFWSAGPLEAQELERGVLRLNSNSLLDQSITLSGS